MFMRNLLICSLLFTSDGMAAEQTPQLGRPSYGSLVKQWNIDIFPDGTGLPPGQGTVSEGKKVYEQYCQSCHGFEGTGASADELAGAQHGLTDDPPDKIIGTYWPYATTLFDFNRRAMPLNNPGILNNDQLYAVTAYLLYLNGVIDDSHPLDAYRLKRIKMPNQDGFINIYQQENN